MQDFSIRTLCEKIREMPLPEAHKYLVDQANYLDSLRVAKNEQSKVYNLSKFAKAFLWYIFTKGARPAGIDDYDFMLLENTLAAILRNIPSAGEQASES